MFSGLVHTEKVYADYPPDYNDFICLFTPTSKNCDHSAPPEAVKRGEKSGIAYGQPTKDGVTATGIKQIVMLLGLSLNGEKDIRDGTNSESRYFYKRVADPRDSSFIIRLKYTKDNGDVSYQLDTVLYTIYNNSIGGSGITITGNTIKGDAYTNGQLTSIAFYKEQSSGDLMIEKQVVNKTISFPSEIAYTSTTKIEADFWYCGGESTSGDDVNGLYAPRGDGNRVEYFTTDGKFSYKNNPNETSTINGDHGIKYPRELCNGEAAYKIGQTTQITLPKTQAAAQTESEQQVNSGVVSTTYTGSIMPQCHILNGWGPGSGSFLACISNTFYYIVFKPVAWFAWLMGQIFDFFIGYSLSDEAYRHDFVQTAWQLVRDISNIFFIIIMIWSGLSAVFNTSKLSYKKVIPTLIINALIINFSLFATRVVIDISNITARLFYDRIEVCQKDDSEDCATGPGGFKSVSASIVSSFNPQKVIQNANLLNTPSAPDFNPDADTEGSGSNTENGAGAGDFNAVPNNGATDTSGLSRSDTEYAAYFGLVTLIMIMIAFGTALMFWKTAFMFVGRVIGLYVAMIFSPFAFLSRGNIPLVGGIPGINYSSWMKDLTNYALLAPIFVFFLYIIHSFLQVDFINGLGLEQNTSNFFEAALYVVVPMLIIYGLISKGVGIAKGLAGSLGNAVQDMATKATGVVAGGAFGVATGGLAYAGSRFGSRIGRAIGQSRLGRRASLSVARNGANASWIARNTNNALNWMQSSSWDARRTQAGALARNNTVLNSMGVRLQDNLSDRIGLGERNSEGGYVARQERRQKELKDKIENVKFSYLNDEEAKKLWKEVADAKVGNDTTKQYLEETDANFKQSSADKKTLEDEVKASKKKIDSLEADLKTNNKLSEADMRKAKTGLDTERTELSKKEDKIIDIQKTQLQAIKDINTDKTKRDAMREDQKYKDAYKEKTTKLQETYGKVENTKDLTNAARRDYAESLRNDSFWMKDGKQKKGLWGLGGIFGGTLGAIAGVGASTAFGSIVAEQFKFEQEALDAATKKYIKDYSKGKGKTSKLDQYKNQVDALNKKIKEAIVAKDGGTVDDINLDDHTPDKQKGYVQEHVENLRAEFDAKDADFKDATDTYRKSQKQKADKDAYAAASKARKQAEDKLKAMEGLWKTKAETEDKIKKEEDQDKK